MANRRELQIIISGDAKGLQSAYGQASSATGKYAKDTDSHAKKIAGAIAGAFAVDKVIDFGRAITNASSDQAEALSKSNTIFGEQGKAVEAWASGTAKAIGQSKTEALTAAGTFGNLFDQLGVGADQSAAMSMKLTTLASDFASFHNAMPVEVVDAMTSAFRGEYDALQRFVPTINAAAVEQKALAMTGKASAKALTDQEKALAVNALMFENAGEAAGDFARTSGGAANQQRILSASWKDAQAKLGSALIPAVTKVTQVLTGLINFLDKNRPVLYVLVGLIGTALVGAFVAWTASLFATGGALAFMLSPIALVVAAVAGVAAGIIYAYNHFEGFRNVVDAVGRFLRDTVWPIFKTVGSWLANNFVGIIQTVGRVFLGLATGGLSEVVFWVRRHWDDIVGFVTGLPGRISSAARGMWDGIKDAFKGVLNWIIRGWNSLEFKIPGFDPPGPGPKFGGFTLGVPDLKELHTGGVVPGGVSNEPVYRLQGGEGVFTPDQMAALGMRFNTGGGTTVVNIDMSGAVISSEVQFERMVVKALNRAGLKGVK